MAVMSGEESEPLSSLLEDEDEDDEDDTDEGLSAGGGGRCFILWTGLGGGARAASVGM